MKRLVAGLLAATMVLSASALDISVGGDLDFTHQWNTTKTKDKDGKKTKYVESQNFFGINVFGDFQYVIVGIGGDFSVGAEKSTSIDVDGKKTSSTDSKVSMQYFNMRLLGKYPFNVGIAKLYPMAGFQFSFNTAKKYDGKDAKKDMSSEDKADLNKYYFILGFGADIFATDNVFIRVTPMFGFQLNKPHDYKDTKDFYSKFDTKYSNIGYMFNLGIGAGYKF